MQYKIIINGDESTIKADRVELLENANVFYDGEDIVAIFSPQFTAVKMTESVVKKHGGRKKGSKNKKLFVHDEEDAFKTPIKKRGPYKKRKDETSNEGI